MTRDARGKKNHTSAEVGSQFQNSQLRRNAQNVSFSLPFYSRYPKFPRFFFFFFLLVAATNPRAATNTWRKDKDFYQREMGNRLLTLSHVESSVQAKGLKMRECR